MAEPLVCAFPHSDDEFPSATTLYNFSLVVTLPAKRGKPPLRRLAWKVKDFKAKVVARSLVVFREGAVIVGDDTVENAHPRTRADQNPSGGHSRQATPLSVAVAVRTRGLWLRSIPWALLCQVHSTRRVDGKGT